MNVLGCSAPVECTFRVRLGSTVWSVTRNEVFYGDYLTRGDALEGARVAARAVEGLGGAARVVAEPGGILIAHNRSAYKP